ncbi:MAG TPA: HD domain-containing phosphohydrolase [Gemmatimonadaceae bacterium]|jgi:response regulator RpfG family c-di-GMP phosphodiesterase
MSNTTIDSIGRPRVLCVDDDPFISTVQQRILSGSFDVALASSATEGAARIANEAPFAVVVSDYRMPGTDGVTFLSQVREMAPDTVRILLTGNGDFGIALAAVNKGEIFRFLEKPCTPDMLKGTVKAAADLYRIVTAERVLLEQTLHGSVKALIDVLALAQPQAFGRATRVRRHVAELAEKLGERDRWSIEIAAMLSQVGCAALPAEAVDRYFAGESLTKNEQELVDSMPLTAERVIAGIPRLEAVRDILRLQNSRHQPGAVDTVPIGARILKTALDFDLLELHGLSERDALATMHQRTDWYDPRLLTAFAELRGASTAGTALQEMRLSQVRVGMVFAADLRTESGMLLVARGQEVSVSMAERIRHQWDSVAARLVVSMMVPAAA